jgi:hypothetical protein
LVKTDVIGIAPRDLSDGQLGGGNDRAQALEVAVFVTPRNLELTGGLARSYAEMRVVGQPNARRLKDRGNGCTDDVFTELRKIGVARRQKSGKPVAIVPVKGDLEHGT